MKQFFTRTLAATAFIIALTATTNKANSQCATGTSFTPASTNLFTTTAEGFTGDFSWTAGNSGSIQSTAISAGTTKVLLSSSYFLPASTPTLYWGIEWAGSANIATYTVEAVYNNGTSKVVVCTGGPLNNNNIKLFSAPAPVEIQGQYFQFRFVLELTGANPHTKSFLDFTTNAFNSNIALPVRLTSFTGSIVNKKAQIKWSVDENETGSHFNVERSSDGRNFTSAAMIMNTAKAGMESYTYTDVNDLNGAAYYRLKMSNKDGSEKFSNVIMLKAGDASSNSLTLMQNPVTNSVNFTYNAPKPGTYSVSIYNTAGLKLFASKINCQSGVNSVSLPIDAKMASGVYVMEVSGNAERAVKQILKK